MDQIAYRVYIKASVSSNGCLQLNSRAASSSVLINEEVEARLEHNKEAAMATFNTAVSAEEKQVDSENKTNSDPQ